MKPTAVPRWLAACLLGGVALLSVECAEPASWPGPEAASPAAGSPCAHAGSLLSKLEAGALSAEELEPSSPAAFEEALAECPGLSRALAAAASNPSAVAALASEPVFRFVAEVARLRGRQQTEGIGEGSTDFGALAVLLLNAEVAASRDDEVDHGSADPDGADPGGPFDRLARTLTEGPNALDRARLLELSRGAGLLSFDEAEELALSWRLVARRGSGRRLDAEPAGAVLDTGEPILASIFSLPSRFFSAREVSALLEAVHSLSPDRHLVVLTDEALAKALRPASRALGLELIPTLGEELSPWPRDPFSFIRRRDGGLHLRARPEEQAGREGDAAFASVLIRGLPETLDRLWGGVTWSRSAVGFHNGQVLHTPGRVWVGVHGVEFDVLRLLGLERVPVESFGSPEGAQRYAAAVHQAVAELGALYGKPAVLVDPLPATGAQPEQLTRLAGGAGHDLDSLLTLLPKAGGGLTALVGDLGAGAEVARRSPEADLRRFAELYSLSSDLPALRSTLVAHQSSRSGQALQRYLDALAERLADEAEVVRLPLLLVPRSLSASAVPRPDGEFLVGWNNVVLEGRGEGARAEGFASGLVAGDELARTLFARAGYRLELLPVLAESVFRGGGYRCASNHVRAPAQAPRRPR